jgi:hypothetical protein
VSAITWRRWFVVMTLAVAAARPAAGASCIATFETGRTPSSEIHVATTGSDASGNGTAGAPFATIERAARAAGPGAAIRVHAGTYAGDNYIDGLTGTAAAPIWIGGAPGEARPVLQGGVEGLHLSRVRYVVVHDLEVRNSTGNGINTDDGGTIDPESTRHVVFRNLYIHHIGTGGNNDCLKLSGVYDYFVLDSEIGFCSAGGSGIDHVGCHGGLIVGNYFHDNGNSIQTKGGSADIEIRANRFLNGGARTLNIGGSTGLEFFRPPLSTTAPNAEARNIRVIGNVIEGTSQAPLAFVGVVDSLVAHNTIVAPAARWLMRILQETNNTNGAPYTFLPAGSNTVAGNIFYFSSAGPTFSTHLNIGPDTAPATFTFSRNLWYAYNNPAQSQPALPSAESNGVAGQTPLLLDVAAGDYRLNHGSPAALSGAALASVATDFRGARYAATPSRGAFEYDVITHDTFCSGTLAAWSSAATDGGDLAVSTAAGLDSTRLGLQAVVDDTTGLFVQDDAPLAENRYRARLYVDPNGFDPGEALDHRRTRIFILFQAEPQRRLAAVVLRRVHGSYALMARARLDDNAQADTAFVPIADSPHVVEIEWRRSSGPDARNGSLQMWIDGLSVASLTGLDNSSSGVDFVRLGALSVKNGASGTMFFDEFESRRQNPIGP